LQGRADARRYVRSHWIYIQGYLRFRKTVTPITNCILRRASKAARLNPVLVDIFPAANTNTSQVYEKEGFERSILTHSRCPTWSSHGAAIATVKSPFATMRVPNVSQR
jgi:hypothetical protein